MSVVIYADAENGKLQKNAYEAVLYGSQLADKTGGEAIAVVSGEVEGIDELGKYGASKILHASSSELNKFDPQLLTAVMKKAVEETGADTIVFSHDFSGKSIAPRLSVALDAGMVSGAVEFPNTDDGYVVKKSVFSGKAFANVAINTEKKIISLLPNSIQIEEKQADGEIQNLDVDLPERKVRVKEVKKESSDLSLTEADRVVSAGRGLKGPENWDMIEELAKELEAATACSRPVADMEWRPHHEHVGQTGIAIRPNLYMAIGISGAIQHLAGVNQSKCIVVINNDPEAPFFKSADYGIVGDAFEVVPKLIEAVKNFKASN